MIIEIVALVALIAVGALASLFARERHRCNKMTERWIKAGIAANRWKAAAEGREDPLTGREPPGEPVSYPQHRDEIAGWGRDKLERWLIEVSKDNAHLRDRCEVLQDALEQHQRSCNLNAQLGRDPDP